MKRGFVTYSEAFKMQVVEQISQGKFATAYQAQKAYGICGADTVQKWIKKYGRPELLPKRVRVETMTEIDELKEAKKRIRDLEKALADSHMDYCLERAFLEIAWEIVAGRRRVAAAKLLGWKTIAARVLEGDEIKRAEEITGAENINRLGMHPLDEATLFKKLLENGEQIENLAKRFDRTVGAIYQRLQLLELDPCIITMFRLGNITLQSAAMLNSLDKEGQELFNSKFKGDYRIKDGNSLPEWEVTRFISDLQHDRLFKGITDKQCETCKTRTYFTDTNLFPELSSMEDSCLNHACYLDKWIKALERKIKNLKGENKSHAEANILVSTDSRFRKILGKTVTLDQVEYKLLHDHWETRAEKEGRNTHPCFSIELSTSGNLEIKPSFRKEPKTAAEKKEESKFASIVNLLELPKEEAAQTIATFESKFKPKNTWDNPSSDVKRAIRQKVIYKVLEIKAQQPDNEKEIDLFLETNIKRKSNEKVIKLFAGTNNIKDIRKLSWPKLFAMLNALDRCEPYHLPDIDQVSSIKTHAVTEWAGISIAQLKEMYREEIKAQVPSLKQETKKAEEVKPSTKKKPHTGLLQGKGKGKKK